MRIEQKNVISNERIVEFRPITRYVTKYIADDGKEFDNEGDCKQYEKRKKVIELGASQFSPLPKEIDNTFQQAIISICMGGYNISSACLIIWTGTRDIVLKDRAIEYLQIYGYSVVQTDMAMAEEGVKYLVANWIESESSDYPDYETKMIPLNSVKDTFNNLLKSLESC
jgi:hypothetical protein